jgi:hypothetical protein
MSGCCQVKELGADATIQLTKRRFTKGRLLEREADAGFDDSGLLVGRADETLLAITKGEFAPAGKESVRCSGRAPALRLLPRSVAQYGGNDSKPRGFLRGKCCLTR